MLKADQAEYAMGIIHINMLQDVESDGSSARMRPRKETGKQTIMRVL